MGALFMILVIVAMLYALLAMPRVNMRPDMSRQMTDYAHRGLFDNSQGVPENSLSAFRYAVEREYGIELDVQLTADGEVVVFHDYSLKRMCGDEASISSLTLDRLKGYRLIGTSEAIPTLSEVLDLVDGRVPILIELKGEDGNTALCAAVASLLMMYGGTYSVQSFNPLLLRWFKKFRPDTVRGLLYTNFVKSKAEGRFFRNFALSAMLANFLSRPDFIAADERFLRALPIRVCNSVFNTPLFVWTVRKQEHYNINKENGDFSVFEGFDPKNFNREDA